MGTVELWIMMYFCVGGLIALVTLKTGGKRRFALAAVIGWPLWAPAVLLFSRKKPEENMVERIDSALREGVEATRGTPLGELLSEDARKRIVEEATATELRCREAETELAAANCSHQREVALRALREKDLEELSELARLSEALRGQVVVARLAEAEAPAEAPGAMVFDLWRRVESLTAAMARLGGREAFPRQMKPRFGRG